MKIPQKKETNIRLSEKAMAQYQNVHLFAYAYKAPLDAIALYGYIVACYSKDEKFTIERAFTDMQVTRHSVRAAYKKLVDCGLITRERLNNSYGKFSGEILTIGFYE